MNKASYQCTVLFCATLVATNAFADDLDQWVERNPYPIGQTIHSLIFANGMFAAVSRNDVIFTSETGAEWTARYPRIDRLFPSQQCFRAIAFGEGQFVAVGELGILVSADGTNWTAALSVSDLTGIAYGGGRFVATSFNSVWVSEDGRSWSETPRSWCLNPLSCPGFVIAYVDGKFIANANGIVAISTNGVDWIDTSLAGDFSGFSAGNGRIVAVGQIRRIRPWEGWQNGISTSLDGGMTWARSDPTAHLENITFGSGVFVTVGERGTILTSNDGITWTTRNSDSLAHLICVAYGQGNFVATGSDGTVLTSADGISWTTRSYGTTHESFSDVTFGNGLFVAVTSLDPSIQTSPDGIHWTGHDPGVTNPLRRVIAAPGIFVTVGDGGTILTSSNGFAWTRQNSGTTNALSGVAYGDGKFVAVGGTYERHVILSSNDGVDWRLRATGTNPLYSVAYGSGRFVAVGGNLDVIGGFYFRRGTIISSIDGETWIRSDTNYWLTALSIAFGGGRFVVVGYAGYPIPGGYGLTSMDGVAWTGIEVGGGKEAVTYGDGTFVAVGWHGTIRSSLDGISWTSRDQWSRLNLRGIAYGNRTFIAVGLGGTILQSANVATPWLKLLQRPGGLTLTLEGEIGRVYRIEASTDLIGWSEIGSVTNSPNEADILDSTAGNFSQRFYRAVFP